MTSTGLAISVLSIEFVERSSVIAGSKDDQFEGTGLARWKILVGADVDAGSCVLGTEISASRISQMIFDRVSTGIKATSLCPGSSFGKN